MSKPPFTLEPSPSEPRPAGAAAAPRVVEVKGPMFIDTAKGRFDDLAAPAPAAITRREFERELERLQREHGASRDNPGSVGCKACSGCSECMFCEECERCHKCTHSKRCKESSHLTHCTDCVNCHRCAYCVQSEHCTGSSYLVLCRAMSDCTYCFGCVGLHKKDFHVLNVKYTRNEYFRIVEGLKRELGL